MIGEERRVNVGPASDIAGSRDSDDVTSTVFLTLTASFQASSVPDTYAPRLANPAKRTVFPNSSDKTLLEVILLCHIHTSETSNVTKETRTLDGLAWSLAQSCDDGCVTLSEG